MPDLLTLVHYLESAASKNTGVRFIEGSSEEEFLSYDELLKKAQVALGFLQKRGVRKGDEVIFQFEDNRSFLISFWGCVLGGIIPVPINPAFTPETRSKLINVWNSLNNPFILTEEKAYSSFGPKIHESELKNYNASHLLHFEEMAKWTEEGAPFDVQGDDIAFIQFSSGSTGSPKGVVLTHDNLITNIKAITNCSDLTQSDSTLGWMPLTHDLGLIGFHLTPVLNGINQFLIPTNTFIRRPSLWISKINEHRVSFTASPNFGYKHFLSFFKEEAAEGWELSCVRRILNGAEPISADLCHVFLEFLADYGLDSTCMFPVYGMAEASLAVAFPEPGKQFEAVSLNRDKLKISDQIEEDPNGVSFVCVGTQVDDCEIRISSENYIPLEEGRIGHIEIRGGNVTGGYYNNEEANRKTFSSGGWLRTGDLGFFKDGKLYITGRSKDIIFSNGLNIYPHDIERITEEVEGVDLGKVVVCGVPNEEKYRDEVLAFVFFKGKPEDFVDLAIDIKAHVNRKLSLELDAVLPVRSIEKTTSGKVKRFHYANAYAQGEYDELKNTIHELTLKKLSQRKRVEPRDELERELFLIWTHILGRNDVGIHENFFELGGNSLKANMLLGRISKELKVDLSIREVFKSPTIAAVATIIKDKKEQSFTSIPKVSERRFYPCSSTQRRLFFLHQLNPESLEYNITSIQKVEGGLDRDKLQEVFSLITSRHEVLRVHFDVVEGEPVQRVSDNEVFVQELPFNGSVQNTIKEFVQPFDLLSAPLLRIGITTDEAGDDYLIFDIHHILSDGYSMSMIINEFTRLYAGESVEVSDTNYLDYAVWEEDFLSSQSVKEQKEYWLERLSGELPVLNFPTDRPRSGHVSKEGDVLSLKIDKTVMDQMSALAEQQGATYYMLFVAALNIALAKYTQQEDVIIGTPVANRPHNDLDAVFGPFINTLPLRQFPEKTKTVSAFIDEIKESVLDAISNQNYPFEQLVEDLKVKRDTSRNALFDVLFTYQNLGYQEVKISGKQVQSMDFFNGTARFDIALDIFPYDDHFTAIFEYSTALFDKNTIEQFGQHFVATLKQLLEQPNAKIADIQPLSEEDQQHLTGDFCGTLGYSTMGTAVSLFVEQAKEHPKKEILFHEGNTFTYQQLDQASDALAATLLDRGLQQEQVVGIMLPRGVEFIISMLGIMKAGGAYLPIDVNYPAERIQYVIDDSNAPVVITDGDNSHDKYLPFGEIDLNSATESIDKSQPEGLAYLIYTSGSTGNPKGVAIEHRNIMALIDWAKKDILPIGYDVLFAGTSFSFDLSVFEMFVHLGTGIPIRLLENGLEIPKYLGKHQNVLLNSVPSVINDLVAMETDFSHVNAIIMCGEPIPQTVKDGLPLNNMAVLNLYGPSEDTVYSTIYHIQQPDTRQIIGKPLPGTKCYIVDAAMQLVPEGVAGELLLSGAGLARGYYGKEEITKEKFLESPFAKGERVYRTGDLVKWNKQGELEFLGRIDSQVKVRGHRIELGEIESRLLQIDRIREAAAVVKEVGGDKHICAYFTTSNTIEVNEIRERLKAYLPEYMIPSFFTEMEEMPETANGKIDKKALPDPELGTAQEKVLPSTDIEIKLAEIWAQELGISEDISVTDTFFDLGGHSLKAAVVTSKIHRQLGVEISLRTFFATPTISGLASQIEESSTTSFPEIRKVATQDAYEVSAAQQRMYVLNQVEGESTSYNMPGAFWVQGPLDQKRLSSAFEALVKKHESLRTTFEVRHGKTVQIVHNSFPFEIIELTKNGSLEDMVKGFIQPFDLAKLPLFRVGLYKESADKHLLVFDIHHIISDGASNNLIIRDFIRLYDQEEVAPLQVQYKDFAYWQQEILSSPVIERQREFWLKEFSGDIPVLSLPTDFERPKVQQYDGETFKLTIPANKAEKLKQLSKGYDVTLFMMLVGVYNMFLSRQGNQKEVVIGTPGYGRSHPDLADVIGVFVNTIPLRFSLDTRTTLHDYFQYVKQKSLTAFENQHYQYDQLVEELNLERDSSRNPLFDTMFVLQNMDHDELKTKQLNFESFDFDLGVSQFDFGVIAQETDNGIEFTFEYCTHLFKQETAHKLAHCYLHLLDQVVTKKPDALLRDINILSEEQQQLLKRFNPAPVEVENAAVSVVQQVQRFVETTPDAIAVQYDDVALTYKELDEHSDRLAAVIKQKGLGEEDRVSIILNRSERLIISVLAVWKARCAYIPIDPEYPQSRIKYMISDSNSSLILSETSLDGAFENEGVEIFYVDQRLPPAEEHFTTSNTSESLAYIIYTSGSTGTPKGVLVEHRCLLNIADAWRKSYELDHKTPVLLQMASFSFDVFVGDLLRTLTNGGKMVICPSDLRLEPPLLYDLMNRHKVTLLESTPALVIPLMDHIYQEQKDVSWLDLLIVGSDSCTNTSFRQLVERYGSQMRILNSYGVTEATIDSSYFEGRKGELAHDGMVPIGKPLQNTQFYILDDDRNFVPIGTIGELYIGGQGVARGYNNQPELTSKSFIESPFNPEERLYKTGDMACWLPDGNVSFKGRSDYQIKIRGYRVELGEIENVLLDMEHVKECVVLDFDDENKSKFLCAFMVSDEEYAVKDIRTFLLDQLPPHMVPLHFVFIDKIPLTPNGKVDRRELPRPEIQIDESSVKLPESEIEEIMVNTWSEVLGIANVSTDLNFFSAGGDSIKAIQVSSALLQYNLKLEVKHFFTYPTISELAPHVEQRKSEVPQEPVVGGYELSPIQQYFFEEQFANPHHWNQSVILSSSEALELEKVSDAWAQVMTHHDVLRSRFTKDGALMYTPQELEAKAALYEVTTDAEITQLCYDAQQQLNIENGELSSLLVFKKGEEYLLFIAIHHLVVDGISWRILLEDFQKAYFGDKLPFKTNSYADWTSALFDFTQNGGFEAEKSYWSTVAEEAERGLYPAGTISMMKDSVTISKALEEELAKPLLGEANVAYNTDVNDLLLSALMMAFHDLKGNTSLSIALEGHGREEVLENVDISRTVGWFTSLFPVNLKYSDDLRDLIVSNKDNLHRIPNKGMGYAALKHFGGTSLDIEPQIVFNYLGDFESGSEGIFRFADVEVGEMSAPENHREQLLEFNLIVKNGELVTNFTFDKNLMSEQEATELLEKFNEKLTLISNHCMGKEESEITISDVEFDISTDDFENIFG